MEGLPFLNSIFQLKQRAKSSSPNSGANTFWHIAADSSCRTRGNGSCLFYMTKWDLQGFDHVLLCVIICSRPYRPRGLIRGASAQLSVKALASARTGTFWVSMITLASGAEWRWRGVWGYKSNLNEGFRRCVCLLPPHWFKWVSVCSINVSVIAERKWSKDHVSIYPLHAWLPPVRWGENAWRPSDLSLVQARDK